MTKPQLSILIASTPSRWDMTKRLYDHLIELAGDKRIEVLLFMDNKFRSIGEKREALKNISNGKYFLSCDSDDTLLSLDALYEATFQDVDVISFKAQCFNSDGSSFVVTQRLGNDIEHRTEDGRYLDCNRPPFHICAWHSKFKKYSYPAISYSEDFEFLKHCWAEAKTECHIDEIIYSYRFDPAITEADTSSNEYWKNPNEPQQDNETAAWY